MPLGYRLFPPSPVHDPERGEAGAEQGGGFGDGKEERIL